MAICSLTLAALLLGACSRDPKDERIVLGSSQIGAESEWRTASTESIKNAAITSHIDLRFADAQQKQVAGRPIARRIVVDETMFTMETAKQFIQTRKY